MVPSSRQPARARLTGPSAMLILAGCFFSACDKDGEPADEGGAAAGGSPATSGASAGGRAGKGGAGGRAGGTSAGGGSAGRVVTAGEGGALDEMNAGGIGGAGAGAGGGSDLAYPLQLTPLGVPSAETAQVGVYFSVTDRNGEPVANLESGDFIVREDDQPIDKFESAFRVRDPGALLQVPTVLVLDLSRSVIEAGALESLKAAALEVVTSAQPGQSFQVITFADNANQRTAAFTSDKGALTTLIERIDSAEGNSTNLHMAMRTGYGLWRDGFYDFDTATTEPELVAGVMIVVSDGTDTAGEVEAEEVLATRGTKRTIFVRVGEDDPTAVALANSGYISVAGGFDELGSAVRQAVMRLANLNRAIYVAEYCSPKRANSHELFFTVAGNELYIEPEPDPVCSPSGLLEPGPSLCDEESVVCGGGGFGDPAGEIACCPREYPFRCDDRCYATAEAAALACGASCVACGVGITSGTSDGMAIRVPFNADSFTSEQCNELFDEPGTGGASGAGGAGAEGGAAGALDQGAGGSGGTPGSDACFRCLDVDCSDEFGECASEEDCAPCSECLLMEGSLSACDCIEAPGSLDLLACIDRYCSLECTGP